MESHISDDINNLNSKKSRIFVLALGGTVSSVAKKPEEEFYGRPFSNINELVGSLPINKEKVTVFSEQFLQKISHEMTYDDLISVAKKIEELANTDEIDGIVVTQGTNCIEETAYFINLVVKTKKCIVFTGSYRPINALGFDGSRNLYNAILIASSAAASALGVVLTFNDCIVGARDALKFNPSIPGDFTANGVGVLGYVQGNNVLIHKMPLYKHTYNSEFSLKDLDVEPKIFIILGHLGMDSTFVEAAVEKKAKGIISAGMGKGYLPKKVTEALIEAIQKGVMVVRCSRSGQGIVNNDPDLEARHGFIAGGSLSPQKARILLLVALSKTQNHMTIQRFFDEY